MNYTHIVSHIQNSIVTSQDRSDEECLLLIFDSSHPQEIFLNHEEVKRANRIKSAKARLSFSSSRSAIRSILGEFLGIKPRSVDLCYGKFGKPFLSEKYNAQIEFNISHAGEIIVIGMTHSEPIGVDIEMSSSSKLTEISSYFLHAAEIEHIASLPPELVENRLLDIWTAKEALLKAVGMGLQVDPTTIQIDLNAFPCTEGYIDEHTQRHHVHWLLQSSHMQVAVSMAKKMQLTVFSDLVLMQSKPRANVTWVTLQ
ncbi:MAG: 4'-phosphopantetheinyl transferase family protein [Akkermansiaceae bacterium]